MTTEQNQLIEKNIEFAYWKAHWWAKRTKAIDTDELISIALLSLTKAAATYDPSKNTKFASYTSFIIDNDIKTELKKAKRYSGIPDLIQTPTFTETDPDLDSGLDIKSAINSLPKQYQEMLIDFYEAGYTQYEIADKYKVSQTKVSIILKKAKELIAAHINS